VSGQDHKAGSPGGGWLAAKLCVAILALAATAATLLAIRQMQTQAAHEYATLRLRVMRVDEAATRLRADIARRISPEALRSQLAALPDADAANRPQPPAGEDRSQRPGAGGPTAPPASVRPRRLADASVPDAR